MNIRITFIEFNPNGVDLPTEHVVITSFESTDINLVNWTIKDTANHIYVFPDLSIHPGDSITIWTKEGINDEKNLFWGRKAPVWNNTGDTAILCDSENNEIHRLHISTDTETNGNPLSLTWGDYQSVSNKNIWITDINGDDAQEVLFYSTNSSNWYLGTYKNMALNWNFLNNCSGFGNLIRDSIRIYIHDFKGTGEQQVLFYHANDGNWWLGTYKNGSLTWAMEPINNSNGFGDLTRKSIRLFTGNFTGSGNTELLLYCANDGNWWFGTFTDNTLSWSNEPVNNCKGFGDLTRASIRFFTGDFTGSGKTELLFYCANDGNFWFGTFIDKTLIWSNGPVNNCKSFGDLTRASIRFFTGDFSGSGKSEILFYCANDGNWWFGSFNQSQLAWNNKPVNNCTNFGDLTRDSIRFFIGDFTGSGKQEILFYCANDGNWWLGSLSGDTLDWGTSPINNCNGFGNLLRANISMWSGDFEGSGQVQILFHCKTDGNWWLGSYKNSTLTWSLVSDTYTKQVFPLKLHIKTSHNYLQLANNNENILTTCGVWPGLRETFLLEEISPTSSGLLNGTKVSIKTYHGNYLKLTDETTGKICEGGNTYDKHSIFTIVIPDGFDNSREFNVSGRKFGLKASNEKFLCPVGYELYAKSDSMGSKETFYVETYITAKHNTAAEGRIINEIGNPAIDILVKIYDEDVFNNVKLGSCNTDDDGYFYIKYHPDDYGLLEKKPDLILKAYNDEILVLDKSAVDDINDIVYNFGTIQIPGNTTVPNVKNCSYKDAKELIEKAELKLVAHNLSGEITNNLFVSSQEPSAGTSLPKGSTVTVFLESHTELKGVKSLSIYNQSVHQCNFTVWKNERTNVSQWSVCGKIQYKSSQPYIVEFKDTKLTDIAVTEEGITYDPNNVSSYRFLGTFIGDKDGEVLSVTVI
jgi:hypothetical protein